jgi:prepilin-type N-terminal cleavage/methylation domain-containing protein
MPAAGSLCDTPMKASSSLGRAFTLIELLVTIAIIVVLASLLLSSLARAKEQARRLKCISNLKQIALAVKAYALDHDGKVPWHTRVTDGGTYGTSARTAWRNFSSVSNEIEAPQVLVCPSDRATAKMAQTWAEFMGAAFRSNALSFFVGLDAYEQMPVAMLAGDRNITGGRSDSCGSVAASPGVRAREFRSENPSIRWTSEIHSSSGDIALSDGSVHRANKGQLQEIVTSSYRYLTNGEIRTLNGSRPSNHLLLPR